MRKRLRTGNKRSAEAHKAVLDAALGLIAERGPTGFAMEAVAKRAGVGKPTIYRWWPDKTELLLELFHREILPPPEIPEEADLLTELKLRMHELFRSWRETSAGRIFCSLVVEMQASSETVKKLREEALAPRRRQSVMAFQRARDRGEIASDVDLEGLVDLLYGWAWYRLMTGQLIPDSAFEVALEALAKGAGGVCSG
ncbi:TetR/AcrR family transcriptional regulator [Kushneria aurantia]|uniref:TetR/AcrR family transcriptional regulator n=1 Tax=Kushneria aurantia TaxID=504092 RepID=A0ABV6G1V7_9GAMM|nr:TetR/AcrR family transcriptional regulator [Kushneria aurantia]